MHGGTSLPHKKNSPHAKEQKDRSNNCFRNTPELQSVFQSEGHGQECASLQSIQARDQTEDDLRTDTTNKIRLSAQSRGCIDGS